MVYDIAALQARFGANMSFRLNDDVYNSFRSSTETIWDAGGIDHVDGTAFTTAISIDLNEGAFSSLGAKDNLSIAYGAVIENATGGASDDRLIGNGAKNVLLGRDGADILAGGGGADTLAGGAGLDAFVDTRAGLAGDTITDLTRGERITVTDGNYAGFTLKRVGETLTWSDGTSTTLTGAPAGRLVLTTNAAGGVDLTLTKSQTRLNDFDGDGHADILWRNASGALAAWSVKGNVRADQLRGDAYFDASVGADWKVEGTFDFDGDGRSDILWRNASGSLSVWTKTDAGFAVAANASATVGTDWRVAGLGDFNGDGKGDLMWRHTGGSISLWSSSGAQWWQNTYSNNGVGLDWKIAGVGDLNGDGRDDLVWRNASSGGVAVWGSQLNGGFSAGAVTGVGTDWKVAGIGDFDADGRDDILWRNDGGAVAVWRSTPNTGYDASSFGGFVGTDWSVAQVADFNNDGRDDVLWRNANGALTIWQANGSGFVTDTVFTSVGTDWQVAGHRYADQPGGTGAPADAAAAIAAPLTSWSDAPDLPGA